VIVSDGRVECAYCGLIFNGDDEEAKEEMRQHEIRCLHRYSQDQVGVNEWTGRQRKEEREERAQQ